MEIAQSPSKFEAEQLEKYVPVISELACRELTSMTRTTHLVIIKWLSEVQQSLACFEAPG